MRTKRPLVYLTWDVSGMFLWIGGRPQKNRNSGVFENEDATKIRFPVSWYGGLVDEGECREYDPEVVFA